MTKQFENIILGDFRIVHFYFITFVTEMGYAELRCIRLRLRSRMQILEKCFIVIKE